MIPLAGERLENIERQWKQKKDYWWAGKAINGHWILDSSQRVKSEAYVPCSALSFIFVLCFVMFLPTIAILCCYDIYDTPPRHKVRQNHSHEVAKSLQDFISIYIPHGLKMATFFITKRQRKVLVKYSQGGGGGSVSFWKSSELAIKFQTCLLALRQHWFHHAS